MAHQPKRMDMRRSALGPLIVNLYRYPRVRRVCLKFCQTVEGGEFYSGTLRNILAKYHGVEAGAYSYGEGLIPGAFPAGVTIGRYVSIASGVRVFLRNHPLDRLSLHPFFYNRHLGWVENDTVQNGTLEIGHDAWLGERAIVTPGCRRIGIGAAVGAGSVVTKDVPDFAIVAGNPARLLRFRFSQDTIDAILASRWWERSIEECGQYMSEMTRPVTESDWLQNALAAKVCK